MQNSIRWFTRVGLLVLVACWFGDARHCGACPFCASVSQTFTEEMNSMEVVVIAKLVDAPPIPEAAALDPSAPLPQATFRVVQVMKGSEWMQPDAEVKVVYFGEANKDRSYLMMGTDAARKVLWSTPLGLSPRALDYVLQLPKLPNDASRLEFFQEYLEDEDEMLIRDAYDEFAKAPYKDVITLGPKMHRDRLLQWVADPNVPPSRKRLYFTMLGVCGKPEDAATLNTMMLSNDRKQKAGLDAMLACYLILRGADGLTEVEKHFLLNPQADYPDTYAAIMAVRFHGTEVTVIPKSRLIQSLRGLLERPELADLVIPDLARWEDWESMPRLIQLFKDADEKSSWVRVPVVNYLRACPLPEARAAIEELAAIDAEAVKRAETFFPVDPNKPAPAVPPPAGGAPAAAGEKTDAPPIAQPQPEQSSLAPPVDAGEPSIRQPEPIQIAASPADFAPPVREESASPANDQPVATAPQTATRGARTDDVGPAERDWHDFVAATESVRRNAAPAEVSVGERLANSSWFWSVPVASAVVMWSSMRLVLGLPLLGFRL